MSPYRSRHVVAWVAALLLLAPLPLFADSNLDVQCVDASGAAIKDAKVVLQHLNTGKWREKKSDGKGKAGFDKLEDGVYRALGRKEGFDPSLHEFITLKGSARENVTLQYQPGDMAKQVYFENQAQVKKANDLLNQGIASMQANKFAEGQKQLEESLSLYPTNPEAAFQLGIAYIQQSKWAEAEQALKKADAQAAVLSQIPQQPGSTGASPYQELRDRIGLVNSKMGSIKMRAEADKALAAKRWDEAIGMYREILKTDKDSDALYNIAVALAQTRKYDEAIASLDEASKLKPGVAAYASLKRQIIDFKENEKLIQAQAVLDEGNKLLQAENWTGALQKYEEVISRIPEARTAGVWVQVARVQGKLGQPDKAIAAYKKAITLAPDKPDYRKALAQYYLDEKRYEEALDLYAEPAAGSESPDAAVFALGQKLSSQGNNEVAQVALEKVLKLNANHAEAHYELGMLHYYSKKNDKRAKDLLTRYVEIGGDKDHAANAKTVLVVIGRRMAPKTPKK